MNRPATVLNVDQLMEKYEDGGFRSVNAQIVSSLIMHRFLCLVIYKEVFKTEGKCRELWLDIQRYKKIYKNKENFGKLRREATRAAAELMQAKDPLVFKRWEIETNEIPHRRLHLNQIQPSISEKGVHIIHGRIGSGKGEGIVIPDIARYGERARLLVISPNKQDCYEMSEKLGPEWHHYHHFGTSNKDIKKAIKSFDKLVICSGSIRWYREFHEDINKFECIYVDEISQLLMTYAGHKQKSPAFRESLEILFELISCSKRSLFLSADITERNTLEILGRMASECDQKIRYYRNNIDYAEGSDWTFFNNEWELIWEVVDRINSGQRFWGTVDFADIKKPDFQEFVNFLKRHCPGKKIQAFTADALKDTMKGLRLRDMGLQEYIEEQTDLGELDGIIVTTWARNNVSILHEDDKYDMDFSFGIHRLVNNPDEAIQGHRRDRKITDHLISVQNNQTYPIWKNSGAGDMPKVAEEESLKRARIGERMKYYADLQHCKEVRQKRASRQWLVKLILKGMGANIHNYELKTEGRSQEYWDFRAKFKETVLTVDANPDWESVPFKKQRLFEAFEYYDPDTSKWTQVFDNGEINADELSDIRKAVSVDAAERIKLILSMGPENRIEWDQHTYDFYRETGSLLDMMFQKISPNGDFGGLARWYLEAPAGSIWFGLVSEEQSDEMDQLILDNYKDLYRQTIGIEARSVTSFKKFITTVIAPHLELEIWTKVADEKRTQWRDALWEQYYKEWGGKVTRGMKIPERYAVIGEILRNKVSRGLSESFSEPEIRMLDTMKDVVKIRRPDRPILSRICDLYHKANRFNKVTITTNDETQEIELWTPISNFVD